MSIELESEVILDRDFNSLCRTCLKKDGVISIFSEKVSKTEYTLQEKIMAFAYVEIFEGDGLPGKICRACFTQINRAFHLKAQCEYADLVLRQHCSTNKEIVTVESEELGIEEAAEELVEEFLAENVTEELGETVADVFADDKVEKELSSDSTRSSEEIEVLYPIVNLSKHNTQTKMCPKATKNLVSVGENSGEAVSKSRKPSDINKDTKILESTAHRTNRRVIILNDANEQGNMGHVKRVEMSPKKAESCSKEVYACNLCDKTYEVKGSLVSHLLKEHEASGEFPCNYCGRAFTQELLLSMHVKSHTAERRFCCSVCGKCFIEASTLKSHEKRHRNDKRYLCIHCGKFFTFKTDHSCPLANTDQGKTHPCNICGKKFMRVSTLTTHKKRHRVVERFRCSTCSKPFYSRQELERHTNVHLGLRPFACDFQGCGHTFYSQGELNRHKKYHLGEKKFKCDQCNRSFYESGHLTNHKRKHTGERPYICELCPKTFTDSSKLRRHVNTHCTIPRTFSKETT